MPADFLDDHPRRDAAQATLAFGLLSPVACLVLLLLLGTDALPMVLGHDNWRVGALKGMSYLAVFGICLAYPRVVAGAALSAPWLSALLLFAFATHLWSVNPGETQRRLISIGAATLLGMLIGRGLSLRAMILFFASLAVVLAVANFLAVALVPAARGAPPWDDVWRGIFNHKNGLGSACAVVLPFAAYAAMVGESRWQRRVFLCGTIACLALLAASSSRTAQIMGLYALLSLGLAVLLRDRLVAWARLALGMLLSVATLAAVAISTGLSDEIFRAMGRKATMSGRIPIWEHVWPWVEARPLLGYGYSAFWDPHSRRVVSMVFNFDIRYVPWYSHNGIIETLLNTGAVGLAIVVVVMFQAFRAVFRVLHRRPFALDLALPHIFLITFCIQNVAESNILARDDLTWIVFVAVVVRLGVLGAAAQRDVDTSALGSRDLRAPRAMLRGEPAG